MIYVCPQHNLIKRHKMKFYKALIILNYAILLSSCATIISGSTQAVSVDTHPISGAQCNISNDDGKWYLAETPDSVTVDRSYSDLSIVCEKGNHTGSTSVKSKTKGIAFGNIIAGGIIGAAVDAGNGSAYDYPSLVNVKMTKKK